MKLNARLLGFLSNPLSVVSLAFFRIGVAAVLLIQAVMVIPDFQEFYGLNAIIQAPVHHYLTSLIPSSTEVAILLSEYFKFISADTAVVILGVFYLVSLSGLLLGFYTKQSAFVCWLLHLFFARSHSTAYGADTYAHIGLFYLCLVPSQGAFSLDRFRKGRREVSIETATLGLRLIQLHLCLSYLASGIEKAQGSQWWNGEVIWRALMLPIYEQWDFTWLSRFPWVLPVLSIGTLFLEMGYPILMFWKKTRPFCLFAIVSLHAGIGLFLGLRIFALIMIVFNLSLFAPIPKSVLAIDLNRFREALRNRFFPKPIHSLERRSVCS